LLFAMAVCSSGQHATCGSPKPGIYPTPAGGCGPFAKAGAQDCCDACADGRQCSGIYTKHDYWNPDGWSPGIGNPTKTPGWHCDLRGQKPTTLEANASSSTYQACHSPIGSATLVNSNLVYPPGAGPNHLGQMPGRCPADADHRVVGTPLHPGIIGPELRVSIKNGNHYVPDVAACCDLCHATPKCGGWTVLMPQESTPENPEAEWTCTLAVDDSSLSRAFCGDCYSGVIDRAAFSAVHV